ncbi:MAG TPA: HIT family protein [Candidatus Saccharimonas sp.]|nr:HIT family protein [Candidatus Saccharimonas sp.]
MNRPLYYLPNARTDEQRAKMVRLEESGICMFCPEHLAAEQEGPIIEEADYWAVTFNQFPYAGSRLHFLLLPKQHITDVADLSPEAWMELGWLLRVLRLRFEFEHYGFFVRNGHPAHTAGTIFHVHAHVVVGDTNDPAHEPIKVKLTGRPAA